MASARRMVTLYGILTGEGLVAGNGVSRLESIQRMAAQHQAEMISAWVLAETHRASDETFLRAIGISGGCESI